MKWQNFKYRQFITGIDKNLSLKFVAFTCVICTVCCYVLWRAKNIYLHRADKSVEVMLITSVSKHTLPSSTVGYTAITITHSFIAWHCGTPARDEDCKSKAHPLVLLLLDVFVVVYTQEKITKLLREKNKAWLHAGWNPWLWLCYVNC
jgi:hypothetical protein